MSSSPNTSHSSIGDVVHRNTAVRRPRSDFEARHTVGPPDHPYRLLDLDDYGKAMSEGRLTSG